MSGKNEQNTTHAHNTHTHTHTHTHTEITTPKQCEIHVSQDRMFSYTRTHTLRPASGQTHTLSKYNEYTPPTPCYKHNNQKILNHAKKPTTDTRYNSKPRHTNIIHSVHTKKTDSPTHTPTHNNHSCLNPDLFPNTALHLTQVLPERDRHNQKTHASSTTRDLTTPHLLRCGEQTTTTSRHTIPHPRLAKEKHILPISCGQKQEKKTETPILSQKGHSEHRKDSQKTKKPHTSTTKKIHSPATRSISKASQRGNGLHY